MKRKLLALMLVLVVVFSLAGCDEIDTSTTMSGVSDDGVKLAFTAKCYTNDGVQWLEAQGNNFQLEPNKIKTYGYSSNGSWISSYETSSIVSVKIDGEPLDSCGSTIVFADTRLKPCNITFSSILSANEVSDDVEIDSSSRLNMRYWLDLQLWWRTETKSSNASSGGSRLVVIQSQTGNPIAMYQGEDVTWDIPDLPKTTRIVIDGKEIYIHRANFAIISTKLLSKAKIGE